MDVLLFQVASRDLVSIIYLYLLNDFFFHEFFHSFSCEGINLKTFFGFIGPKIKLN